MVYSRILGTGQLSPVPAIHVVIVKREKDQVGKGG
jgi:hypothetical protein